MQIFNDRKTLREYLDRDSRPGLSRGFVPTMGALHEGHISLILKAKSENDSCVCSIFVNPTQFNDPRDLEKYPRTPEADIAMLEAAGCDILYMPQALDVYPQGEIRAPELHIGIDTLYEGSSRPGHFAGVAQVVKILLDIVRPDRLYLGQKDYQQFCILSEMIRRWDMQTEVIRCPIYREATGLAMSSRNTRLSDETRLRAGAIYATLNYAAGLLKLLPPQVVSEVCISALNTLPGFQVDYFQVADADTLEPVTDRNYPQPSVIITAVMVDGVRLLDNILMS